MKKKKRGGPPKPASAPITQAQIEMGDSELKRFEHDMDSGSGGSKKILMFLLVALAIAAGLAYLAMETGKDSGPVSADTIAGCIKNPDLRGSSDCYLAIANYQQRKVSDDKMMVHQAISEQQGSIATKCRSEAQGEKEAVVMFKGLVDVAKQRVTKVKILATHPDQKDFRLCFAKRLKTIALPEIESEKKKLIVNDVLILSF